MLSDLIMKYIKKKKNNITLHNIEKIITSSHFTDQY